MSLCCVGVGQVSGVPEVRPPQHIYIYTGNNGGKSTATKAVITLSCQRSASK